MKYLIAGSSGLIGKGLLGTLKNLDHKTVTLVRREAGFEEIQWDPSRGELDLSILENLDAVVNLCGSPFSSKWTEQAKTELYESRINSTKLIAETIAKMSNPPSVLLNASAMGYYGEGGDKVLTEESPKGEGFLADVCNDWEAATKPAADAGIRTVNLRIGLVLGKDANVLRLQLPFFKVGLGGWLGKSHSWLSWMSLRDAANAIVFLAENDSISGPVNFASSNPSTSKEFAKTLGVVLRRPALFPIPKTIPVMRLGSELVEAITQSVRLEPAVLKEAGFHFQDETLMSALKYSLA